MFFSDCVITAVLGCKRLESRFLFCSQLSPVPTRVFVEILNSYRTISEYIDNDLLIQSCLACHLNI